jgi:hypothetical protein
MIKQLTAQRNQFKESHVHALALFLILHNFLPRC